MPFCFLLYSVFCIPISFSPRLTLYEVQMPVATLTWEGDTLRLIDQTLLPGERVHIECRDVETVAEAMDDLETIFDLLKSHVGDMHEQSQSNMAVCTQVSTHLGV